MEQRLNYRTAAPEAFKPMYDMEAYLKGCGLDHTLIELVKVRASQINACAFCLHMHTSAARAAGESEMRLYLLDAWQESQVFTARERAALAWTEALTRVSETHAPDETYAALTAQFTPREIVDLTMAICQINSWNRLMVGFRVVHPEDSKHKAG
jgi:AhpD family alkylhydroperoxidase